MVKRWALPLSLNLARVAQHQLRALVRASAWQKRESNAEGSPLL
jgi:hypothetical protein